MRRLYVDGADGQLHVTVAGTGPALLLVGSAGRSARVFNGLIQLLARDFTVVAPDLPGSGNSDPPKPGFTMRDFARNLVEVLDGLGLERAHFYGFQTGNKVGAALAVGWPGRVGRVVLAGQSHSLVPDKHERDGAILGNVAHYFDEAEMDARARQAQLWATGFKRVSDIWWDGGLYSDPAGWAGFERAREAVVDRVQALPHARATYEANFAYDLGTDIARITAPLMFVEVVTAAEDASLGRQGAKLLALQPRARLEMLHEPDGPSHAVTLARQYPALAALLRGFLLTTPP